MFSFLFRSILVSLIIVGGLCLANHFYPQYVIMTAFHAGSYTVTWGLILAIVLFYAGIKTVRA